MNHDTPAPDCDDNTQRSYWATRIGVPYPGFGDHAGSVITLSIERTAQVVAATPASSQLLIDSEDLGSALGTLSMRVDISAIRQKRPREPTAYVVSSDAVPERDRVWLQRVAWASGYQPRLVAKRDASKGQLRTARNAIVVSFDFDWSPEEALRPELLLVGRPPRRPAGRTRHAIATVRSITGLGRGAQSQHQIAASLHSYGFPQATPVGESLILPLASGRPEASQTLTRNAHLAD